MVSLTHDLIRDENVSDEELAVYLFLKMIVYNADYDYLTINSTILIDQMCGKSNSHSFNTRIAKIIKELSAKGLIRMIPASAQNYYVFCDSFEIPEESGGFVLVDMKVARAIMDLKGVRNKCSVLRQYLLILSSLNNETKVGIYDYNWFAKIMNTTIQTVSKYNKILEDAKLVYIYRAADFMTSNTYGLDPAAVEEIGSKRTRGLRAREEANDNRRYTAMYRNFIGGVSYTQEQLEKMYKVLKNRNNKILDEGVNARGELYNLEPLKMKLDSLKGEN